MPPIILSEPDDEELIEVAKKSLLENTAKNISEHDVSKLTFSMLSMYKEVTETFTSQPLYKWNASHLKRWCDGIKWHAPATAADLDKSIKAEADMIFKNRLVTDEEKVEYTSISKRHLNHSDNYVLFFKTILRNDGVYMQAVDYDTWYQDTQKLINQCVTENDDNIFSETGIEACLELAILCPAIARTVNGGITICVGGAGAGRRAAAALAAAALPAVLMHVSRAHRLAAHLAAVRTHCTLYSHIKQHLGIVILLDKDEEKLSELIEKYPFLYNDANIVWIEQWSEETLRQMPPLIIQRLIKEDASDVSKEDIDTVPVEGFVNIYKSIDAEWLRAPCRYVNFVKSYYFILSKKKTELVQRKNILSAGVEALRRARSEVATLQDEAAKQEVALSEKQAAANNALDQIGATVRATTDKKDEMHALKKNIEIENEKLQIRKKEIEAELASVEPVIKAAQAAVGEIRPEALSEIRSLRAPPDVVRDVLEGVLRLMGIADTSWHSMKNFLSKRGVKEDIRCLDASQISDEAVQSVQKLLERRGASFEPATARRASAACAPLAAWVRANLHYAAALARVQPLQHQQARLHKNLQEAEAELSALSSGLNTVEERVASLKAQLGEHSRDAATLELKLTEAKRTLEAAQNLLDQLANEYDAWELDLKHISKEILEVNVRSLLAAAYIVYLPDLTEPQARNYLRKWSALIEFEDESFSVINFLSTPEKQLKWETEGLPMDQTAVKNAVIIEQALATNKCGFTPLIIDPDGEAETWLRNTLSNTQCEFVPQHSEKLTTAMQFAIRLGRTLVVTEVQSAAELCVPARARCLLLSRAPAPAGPSAALSPVRFTASLHGLTDQLVHYALQQLNPEVNKKTKEIKIKKATLQKQQYELQENLLKELSKNSDILHDSNLLASLNNTRTTTNTIREALNAAQALETTTHAAYQVYEPIAARAAQLALAVKELAVQRPLVSLPIDTIQEVFVDAIRKSGDLKSVNPDEIMKYLTRRIMERVLLSVHKKDKYIVVLHLLKRVYDELIPENLWNIFIGNFNIIEDQNTINEIKLDYPWVPEDHIRKLALLKSNNEEFFMKMSLDKEALWTEFQRSGNLNTLNKLQLNAFETVVAVSVIRPDALYRAIVAFVDVVLGSGCARGEAVALATRWARGRPALLLAAHAHAPALLASHARPLALAQVGIEEGHTAWSAALEACRGGGWLAIIVGASPFTRDLHNFLLGYSQRPIVDFHDEFRLWVVAEDREIPSYIANMCVTVILEPAEGVRQNMVSTLWAWRGYEAEATLTRVHACLAMLHALAQERRAYIPHGWSRWYDWDWGDVQACAEAVRSVHSDRAMEMGRALCGALYGARVAQQGDAGILGALLRACLPQRALAHAWAPLALGQPLPHSTQLQAYIPAIESWPELDTPQLLGLPANCRVAWEYNAANSIISGLREFNSTIIVEKDDSVTPLKTLLALWKKLMSGNPLLKADYQIEKEAHGWWGSVCAGELREARAAVRRVHTALVHARARALPLHTVPEEWQLVWAGPRAPPAYVAELSARAHTALRRLHALRDHSLPDGNELQYRRILSIIYVMTTLYCSIYISVKLKVLDRTSLTFLTPSNITTQ
ncbi:unnamed protein product [Parnassius apollo]|uniref:(apollo) hypothetical protein n=1 Tax=Parnassius apollo TaxID=110799 RepID=A0A8S3X9I0_PARAO|nr:unnamed protein product [Parnassius apollo]